MNPDEQLRAQAEENRYEALSQLWLIAADDLKRFRIPYIVTIQYADRKGKQCYLSFRKHEGKWVIVYSSDKTDNAVSTSWVPVQSSPITVMVEAITHYPRLRRAVVQAAVDTVSQLDHAIQCFRRILDDCKGDNNA